MQALQAALAERQARGLYRVRRVVDGPQGPELNVDGRRVLAFCSNDYLGLANHPAVVAAFKAGVDRYGVGSGASHLISGHTHAHHALEAELAEFTGRPRALLFSTGYMANLGVISALLGRHDTVLEDRLNHASLLDGARLAGARLKRYPHADAAALARQLAMPSLGRRLVASDGVFSMDGDLAPVPALAAAARRAGAWLMIDDAHGLGVVGPQGKGTLAHFGATIDDVPLLMGTLGKAFGTFGAFVAGPEAFIETLIQRARSYVYTTALPPAVAEASRVSLRLVREGDAARQLLADLVSRFRSGAGQLGYTLMASNTPIQPVLVGPVDQTLALSDALWASGILVSAIRPPTVPEGSARLRVTFSANHTVHHVDRLLTALEAAR